MDRMQTKINDVILLLLSFMAIGMFLFNIGKTLLIATNLLFLLLILLNLGSIRPEYCVLLIINILFGICTLLLNEGVGVVLIFLALFMACLSFNSISFSIKMRKTVSFICFVGVLTIVVTASNIYRIYDWLVLIDRHGNLINNNSLAIFSVAFCFCSLVWNDLRNGKKWKKLFALVSFTVNFLFTYLTGCRSAMFVLITYFVLHWLIKTKLSDKSFRRITIAVLLLSLLFPVFYVVLYRVWPDATILGKMLFSGREAIWVEVFDQIKAYPIFGSGTSLESAGFESVHNMLLGIWKNVGVIPLISLISVYAIKGRVSISRKQQIMLISILIFAFFESFMMDIRFLLIFSFLMIGTTEINAIEENGAIKNDTKKNTLLLVRWKTSQ